NIGWDRCFSEFMLPTKLRWYFSISLGQKQMTEVMKMTTAQRKPNAAFQDI
ncbi:hypothetical protein XENOCAPTIV_022541, partial [Xenoophorus captivus]